MLDDDEAATANTLKLLLLKPKDLKTCKLLSFEEPWSSGNFREEKWRGGAQACIFWEVAANAEAETTGAWDVFIHSSSSRVTTDWQLYIYIYIYGTLKGFFLKNCFEFIYLFYGD